MCCVSSLGVMLLPPAFPSVPPRGSAGLCRLFLPSTCQAFPFHLALAASRWFCLSPVIAVRPGLGLGPHRERLIFLFRFAPRSYVLSIDDGLLLRLPQRFPAPLNRALHRT